MSQTWNTNDNIWENWNATKNGLTFAKIQIQMTIFGKIQKQEWFDLCKKLDHVPEGPNSRVKIWKQKHIVLWSETFSFLFTQIRIYEEQSKYTTWIKRKQTGVLPGEHVVEREVRLNLALLVDQLHYWDLRNFLFDYKIILFYYKIAGGSPSLSGPFVSPSQRAPLWSWCSQVPRYEDRKRSVEAVYRPWRSKDIKGQRWMEPWNLVGMSLKVRLMSRSEWRNANPLLKCWHIYIQTHFS